MGGLGPADAQLLETIAGQMAVALRNARLVAQIQTEAEQAALINAINRKITQTTDIGGAMRVAATELARALEVREAVIRLERWPDGEPKPAPLVLSAGKLQDRLGTAERLSSARFHGTPAELDKVGTMCVVLKGLDEAYVTYRQQLDSPGSEDMGEAVVALEAKVAALAAETWR